MGLTTFCVRRVGGGVRQPGRPCARTTRESSIARTRFQRFPTPTTTRLKPPSGNRELLTIISRKNRPPAFYRISRWLLKTGLAPGPSRTITRWVQRSEEHTSELQSPYV